MCLSYSVTADVILDHLAEVKVDHLSEDGGFWAANAKSGASSANQDIGPTRLEYSANCA
jgi:hypothetical protein